MSSTFELYDKLQSIIPKERFDNIENLKKSFDNILDIISNNYIINKVSSDIDIFYKRKIKNFNLYESKCLKLNDIKEESKKQLLFNKNDNLNKTLKIINYLNDKNNLCIFDIKMKKLIKNLSDLDDLRIVHGFKYKDNIIVTIDNYLNFCINYENGDYKISIYMYKNKVKYPLILFYNSRINYLDEKIFEFKDKENKLGNLLHNIELNFDNLLKSNYSKEAIKKKFNVIEKILIDFFSYQEELKDFKVTRSMNLLMSSYAFQLEYFNGMRILFESLKNHEFNFDYYNKCIKLTDENKEIKIKLKKFKEDSKLSKGKITYLKNGLDKKEIHCNHLLTKVDRLSEENINLDKENDILLDKIGKINRNYRFKLKCQFMISLLLIMLSLLIVLILFNELDDNNKVFKYYQYYINFFEIGMNKLFEYLNIYYNNLINSKFINETIKVYL